MNLMQRIRLRRVRRRPSETEFYRPVNHCQMLPEIAGLALAFLKVALAGVLIGALAAVADRLLFG